MTQVLIAKQQAGIRIGMWINMVVKNFRGTLKPIVYPEIGLQVDIPKVSSPQRRNTPRQLRTLITPQPISRTLTAAPSSVTT